MNKLLTKVAKLVLGLSLAAGVGVAVGSQSKASRVDAVQSTITFAPGTDTDSTSVTKNGVTVTMTTMNNASYYQIYKGQTGTFSCSTGSIKQINFTCTASDTNKYGPGSMNVDDSNGTYTYSGTSGTWTGSSQSISFTASSNQVRISALSVLYDNGQAQADPVVTVNPTSAVLIKNGTTTITATAENGSGNVTWSSDDSSIASVSPTSGNSTTVTGNKRGTTTIKASYSTATDAHSTIIVTDVQHAGTESDPYTVEDARDQINLETGMTNVYVTGVVSAITTAYNAQYGNISFDMSVDGETTSEQIRAYRTVGTTNFPINSEASVQVGDTVTLYGNLTKYNSTYEVNEGNQLVYLSRPTVSSIEISGSMTKTSYSTSEQWDHTGLVVTATYSNSKTSDITSNVTWSYSPLTPAAMGAGTSNLTITATYDEQTDSTSETVTVAAAVLVNSTNLTPGDYYIAYNDSGTKHYISSVASGKGATTTTKESGLVFTFTLVGNDSWQVTNNSNYLGVGSSSTSLTLDSGVTTLSISWENETNSTRKLAGSSGRELAWYASGSDIRTYSGKTDGTNGMTLVDANEVSATYTIQYDSNTGTGSMPNTVGETPQVAECAFTAPSGMQFSRWNTQADGEGTDYAVGTTVTQNLTLYAIWRSQAANPSEYFTKITSVSDVADGKYVIAHGDLILDGSLGTLDVSSNTKDLTLSNLLSCYFTFSNGEVKSASNLYIGHSGSKNTLNQSTTSDFTNTVSFDGENLVLTCSDNYVLRYNASSGQERFRFYSSGSSQEAIQLYKVNFEKVLTDLVTCNAQGTSEPTGTSWSTLEQYFNTLSSSEKLALKSSSSAAMAKYDYIVGKYLKGQGLSAYKDFIGRDPAQIGPSRVMLSTITGNENVNTIASIVIISLVSVTAIGGYFFIKRREQN